MGNEATLIFTLMHGEDHANARQPLGLDDTGKSLVKFFSFSYFDFDMANADARGQECLELLEPAPSTYTFDEGVSVIASDVTASDGKPAKRFCAKTVGFSATNPEGPGDIDEKNLTSFRQEVKDQAVTFEFRDTNVMKVKYSVQCCIQSGRNFVFAGAPPPAAAAISATGALLAATAAAVAPLAAPTPF